MRHGHRYDGGQSYWTIAHVKSLDLGGVLQETLNEHLITLDYLTDKIERFDKRIEELASGEPYREKLSCLIGVRTHTALSAIVEVGNFERVEKPDRFASYLGLVPSEESSGDDQNRGGITKAGNCHS